MGGGNGKEEVGLHPTTSWGAPVVFTWPAMGTTDRLAPHLTHCSWPQDPFSLAHRTPDTAQPGQSASEYAPHNLLPAGEVQPGGSELRMNRAGFPIKIQCLDHIVFPVRDVEATALFYQRVLGMRIQRFASGRVAVCFGRQKINLQPVGWDETVRAERHLSGTQDICLLIEECAEGEEAALTMAANHLCNQAITIVAGPVARTGACGPIRSIYFRDLDGNLIELAVALPE